MSCNEWKEYSLDEICDIRRGASPRPIINYISENGIPWVKIADATSANSRYINETKEFIIKEGKSKSVYVNKGDFILSNSATPGIPKFMGISACIHDGWLLLNNFRNCSKMFIYYKLVNDREKLLSNANGSVFKNLKTDIVKNHKIKLPSLDEQQKIANILSSLDDKIELNNEMNKTLEEIAQSIFKRWFIDFEFTNENGEPYKSSGGEMVDSELGMIPKGWQVKSIDTLTDVTIGKTPPRKEKQWFTLDKNDIKWASIKDLGNCGTYIFKTSEYLTQEAIEKFNIKVVPKNTVILSFKLTVGRVAITPTNIATNEAIAHFRILDSNTLTTEYLYSYLKQFNYESLGSTSSIATAVNSKIIKKMPIIAPSKDIIEKFTYTVSSIFKMIENNEGEILELEALRDSLIDKLMSGEIRVN